MFCIPRLEMNILSWKQFGPGRDTPDFIRRISVLLFAGIALAFITVRIVSANVNNTNYHYEQIRALWYCQQKTAHTPLTIKEGSPYCPVTFDGWICWDSTPAGEEATNVCPSFISSDGEQRFISRKCRIDGTWDGLDNDTMFVNYSSCGMKDAQFVDFNALYDVVNMIEYLTLTTADERAVKNALERCIRDVLLQPFPLDGRLHCRRTFDGWGCWKDTLAGETAVIICPSYIPGFSSTRKAHKICQTDGTWFRHPVTNKTWSNYTTCIDQEDLVFRQYINTLYIVGYSISAVALLISLIIFYYFKSLKCTRTTIHKNLFISFIVNNIMWIVWYTEVVEHPSVILNNEVSCQALHVIVHYLMVSNYFWMFCEGLYLHTVLVLAFVTEETIMKWFYFIGWGMPLLLIIIYASLRGSSPNHTAYCWIQDSVYQWILSGPVCISLLLNLLFLINIVRVLITKLRAVNSPDANQTRKAARATLILIPLLGLHYLLTPFRPEPRSSGEAIYETISAIVTSLQGLCVAFLFCFFNGEVTAALKRKWNLTRLARTAGKRSYAASTSVSFLGRSPSEPDGKFFQETQVFSQL